MLTKLIIFVHERQNNLFNKVSYLKVKRLFVFSYKIKLPSVYVNNYITVLSYLQNLIDSAIIIWKHNLLSMWLLIPAGFKVDPC